MDVSRIVNLVSIAETRTANRMPKIPPVILNTILSTRN